MKLTTGRKNFRTALSPLALDQRCSLISQPMFFLSSADPNNPSVSKSVGSMGKTIGIAVGCAAAYIVLVVGLMIYCKGRRARQNKKDDIMSPECENCKCWLVAFVMSMSLQFILL